MINNAEKSIDTEKHCENCLYFESRTKFCRLNPPQPMIVYDDQNDYDSFTSKFPKIQNPFLDFCSHWENEADNKNQKKLLLEKFGIEC